MFIFQIPTGGHTIQQPGPPVLPVSGGTPSPTSIPTGGPQQSGLPVLPIPSGSATQQSGLPVLPAPGGPVPPPPDIRNSINQSLSGFQQRDALIAQEGLRYGTPIAAIMRQLGATFQPGGHYRLPSGQDIYYQWNHFVYGPLSNSSGQIYRPGPPGSDGRPGVVSSTPVNHGLLFSARVIAARNLVPNPNDSYTFVQGNIDGIPQNPVTYSLQPDGTVFCSGGTVNGQNTLAGTFVPDSSAADGIRFDFSGDRSRPMPGTDLIRRLRLRQTGTPRVFIHPGDATTNNHPYPVYILSDGRLLYLRAAFSRAKNDNGDVQIFSNSSWANAGLPAVAAVRDADVRRGIIALATYAGITAPLSASAPPPPSGNTPPTPNPTLTNTSTPSLTTAEARERYRRFEAQCQIPAINLRIRHANGAIGDNIFSQSTYYLMCVYASRCGMVNDTGFREELTRMIGNRPMERGSFNSTSWALNFVRQNCPALVPANTLNPNEYYVHLIEELMCGTNSSYETTMITHLPTDPQSFSTYTPVSFRSARHLPVNNLIHIFTTDGGMNPAHAALINTRIQQFARLSRTNFYDGSNSWDDNYVQEIVRGIVTDPELGLTTERSREAMTRVLKRVFNAFKTWWTNKSTTDGYQRFSESELRTIAERGRAVR